MAHRNSFDIGTTLRIGKADDSPLPMAQEGEIVLRVTKPFSMLTLRDSEVGQVLINQQFYRHRECNRQVPAGTYRLRIPVPESHGKSFVDQSALLAQGEDPAPIALVAAALLCLKKADKPDPLTGRWTRCAEQTIDNCRAVVSWANGRIFVDIGWSEGQIHEVSSSSSRKMS